MNRTATLPLFPFPVVGRPEPDVEALRERSGVAHYPLPVREILNRQANPRMPFVWSINPYRGCEIGCTYCYARYTHGFFDLDQWRRDAAAALQLPGPRLIVLKVEPVGANYHLAPPGPMAAQILRFCAALNT